MNTRSRTRNTFLCLAVLGFVAACILSQPAKAQLLPIMSQGLTMTETVTTNGKTTTSTNYFSGNATKRSSSEGQDSIIRFDQEKIVTVDHKKKTYSEITFKQLQEMMEKLTTAVPQNAEAMAALKKIMGGSSAPLAISKQGPGETIAGYATIKYLITGPFEMEIWAAPELKLPPAYYDAIKMRLPANPVMDLGKMYDAFKQIDGMAMKSVLKIKVMSMSVTTATEVTSVQKGAVAPATFEVPAGYKLVQEKF